MDLGELLVINQRKDQPALGAQSLIWLQDLLAESFSLNTCLRRVWVTRRTPVLEKVLSSSDYRDQIEVYSGKEAYRFLLTVGAGLESAIPGETDVFGQLKEAWKAYEASPTEFLREIRPTIQRLFEDVKEIRFRFLQGMGGSSYGSLTRMLLGQEREGAVLLVGAGQMARSIVPYLSDSELWLWNRTPERMKPLLEKIKGLPAAQKAEVLDATPAAELAAWSGAEHVVLCIPSDPVMDRKRVEAWKANGGRSGSVLHLGILKAKGTPWAEVPNLKTLSDLFAIQRDQGAARKTQLDQARAACLEKANLRSLGGPSSLAHGWEDLAIFNSVLVE
jgi:glutamyl-tRNA reductase